jgi:hypothetical protein
MKVGEPTMKHPTDLAIDRIVRQGHQVHAFTAQEVLWFEIDGALIASLQELLEMAEGVYSVEELGELVLLRRQESQMSR